MKRFGLIVTAAALAILATASVSSAQMGVAVMWEGGGIPNILALPITLSEGMIFQPMLSIDMTSDKGPGAGTNLGIGGSIEREMSDGNTKPIFGARAGVGIYSPKNGDSYTNFSFGVFVGGSAKLADNVSLVGQWGPDVTMYGKKGSITGESYTNISTAASITLRWWLWGTK